MGNDSPPHLSPNFHLNLLIKMLKCKLRSEMGLVNYLQITFGVSFLKKPVKELLQRFLGFCPTSDAVAAIRAFAFSDIGEIEGGDGKGKKCHYRLPRRDLR